MAEVVGTVASGAGLASLVIQLGDGVVKLKRFCDAVRGAPQDLKDLVFEIETLSLALKQIELDQDRTRMMDRTVLTNCLEMGQQGTDRISKITERMEKSMQRSPLLGAVKTALKERELQQLLRKLERAKSTMLLAYNVYTHEVQRQKMGDIHVTLVSLTTQPSRAIDPPNEDPGQVDPPLEQRLERRLRKEISNKFKKAVIFVRLQLLFVSAVWEVGAARASNGWDAHLRSYNVRPRNSPIFRLCRQGDLAGVQKLLAAKHASVFDITSRDEIYWEQTLLDVRPGALILVFR